MSELVGHLHPSLVHLPIGILLLAIFLQWLARKENYKGLQQAVPIIFLCGAITALVSCITGYVLSTIDDYDKNLVTWHMWMGIGTALGSLVLYAKEKNEHFKLNKNVFSIVLLVLIFVTGHLGGSLTHGSDYFTKPLSNIFSNDTLASPSVVKPVSNVQEAVAYRDIIQPILQTKCYSCHGVNKQKGKLRMDNITFLMKGGKDGVILKPGMADSSEMLIRLLLPTDNEDHMPPKEKSQPTESQIALIHWWINNGADFTKKVNELNQSDKIKPLLAALQTVTKKSNPSTDIPASKVEKADNTVIEKLKEYGVMVLPVAQNSNYLMANFVTDTLIDTEELELLLSLKKQLIWLKLSSTNITNTEILTIRDLNNLTRLSLDNTSISDTGIALLKSLQNLQYLNLVATKVSTYGILQLKGLKALRSLYLYKTNINNEGLQVLKTSFSNTNIDIGGYEVPLLASDTTEVKVEKGY